MDKRHIILLVLSLFFCCSFVAEAQRQGVRNPRRTASANTSQAAQRTTTVAQKDRVQFIKKSMKRQGDSLIVDMTIDMSKLDLKTNYSQILTPVIGSETEEIELPKVLIQGTASNKAFMRELELNDASYMEFESNPPYAIVKPKGQLRYRQSVPFEPWMDQAYLDVEEDLCGCGDEAKIARTRVIDQTEKEVVVPPSYNVSPRFVYIQPEVEPIKKRREIGQAYLEYPRGKNEIFPNFGNNPSELAKIDKMIYDISADRDVTVQGVYMVGYASPESSVKFNTELSRARSESLMRYFMKNSSIPASMFEARTGGEDWAGLLKLLEDYPLPYKSEVLRVINTVNNLDEREHALEKVGGGHPYKIIYDELFPKLRRTDCEVHYTVRDFSLEEAKQKLETAPQMLSLNEMYIVANTYPIGSKDFLRVFDIAREEFPDDPVANLNGAAVALQQNRLREAEKYLALSDHSTPEYANNYGVYLMLTGKYSEAERYLKQAEAAGITEATHNLRELRKKATNVRSRRDAGVDDYDNNAETKPASRRQSNNR